MDCDILAKSDPRQTLLEHSNSLLEVCKSIKSYIGNNILQVISKDYKKIFFDLLNICVIFHDIGKSNTKFQYRIENNIKRKLEGEIDHNLLSLSFLKSYFEIKPYNNSIKHIIYKTIAYHHNSYSHYLLDGCPFRDIQKMIVNDLFPNLNRLKNFLSFVDQKFSIKYSSNLILDLDYEKELNYNFEKQEDKKLYILLKGFLHRLDHLASAGIEKDNFFAIDKENIDNLLGNFISEKTGLEKDEVVFKDFQNKTYDNKDKDILSVAFTGSGKTVSDHRWGGKRKFYLVPTRVSAEAFYLDACKIYGKGNVGILHGDSIIYLGRDTEDLTSVSLSEEDFNLSRNLAKPYIVCTIDQILTFLFRFPRYEKVIASLIGSKITIDEVHLLDPYMFSVAIEVIKILKDFGINFHLMTATMPGVYKDVIEKSGLEFIDNESSIDSKGNLVQVIMKDEEVDSPDIIQKIEQELASHKKVLVVCNTIKKAKNVYEKLEKKGVKPLNLLHSLFTLKHRIDKHSKIMDEQNNSGIWISTQMVEVALDIDFPTIFSELAPIENLIQRMGRCNRRNKYEMGFFYLCGKVSTDKIYNSDICDVTYSILNKKKYKENPLTNANKLEMLKSVYNNKKVKDILTKEFDSARDDLEKLFGDTPSTSFYQLDPILDLTNRRQAQELFRRSVLPIRVIPDSELGNSLELYKEASYKVKTKLYIELLEKTVPVPFYTLKKLGIVMEKPFPIIHSKYNSKTGLDINVDNIL